MQNNLDRFQDNDRKKELVEKIRNNADPPILKQEAKEAAQERYTNLINAFNDLGELYIQKAEELNTQFQAKIKHYIDAAKFFNYAISIAKENGLDSGVAISMIEYINSKIMDIVGNTVSSTVVENSKNDKKELEGLREYARSEVKQIEDLSDQEKIEKTRELFKTIAERMQAFLARLYQESETILGTISYSYSVIGLGSMALKTITPYSDLEFAILTENSSYKNDPATKDYFWKLTQLVHFRIINLGETVIESSRLGNVITDHLIRKGVSFDLGGKTPLGREDKDYSLIQTIDGMMYYFKNEDNKIDDIDKNLSGILEVACHIYKDMNLFNVYLNNINDFLLNNQNYHARAIRRLSQITTEKSIFDQDALRKGDLEDFKPKLIGNSREGKVFDAKKEIYRLTDRLLYDLALFYAIEFNGVWKIIDHLKEQSIINEIAAVNLNKAATFAIKLRLKVYLYYGAQQENILIINNQQQKLPIGLFLFTDKDVKEIFEYYYTVQPLHQKLDELCKEYNNKECLNIFSHEDNLYKQSDFIDGLINSRLGQYDMAKINLENAYKNDESSQEIVNALGRLYKKSYNYVAARNLYMNSLGFKNNNIENIKEEYSIIELITINDIGNTYFLEKEFNHALRFYRFVLTKTKKIIENGKYSSELISMKEGKAITLNMIGQIIEKGSYRVKSNSFINAKKNYDEALGILGEAKKTYSMAITYNIIGELYAKAYQKDKKTELFNQASKNYDLALRSFELIGKHYSIIITLNLKGLLYIIQGNSANALKEFGESLRIAQKHTFQKSEAITYTLIAKVYNSLEKKLDELCSYICALKVFKNINDASSSDIVLKRIKNLEDTVPEIFNELSQEEKELINNDNNKPSDIKKSIHIQIKGIYKEKDYDEYLKILLRKLYSVSKYSKHIYVYNCIEKIYELLSSEKPCKSKLGKILDRLYCFINNSNFSNKVFLNIKANLLNICDKSKFWNSDIRKNPIKYWNFFETQSNKKMVGILEIKINSINNNLNIEENENLIQTLKEADVKLNVDPSISPLLNDVKNMLRGVLIKKPSESLSADPSKIVLNLSNYFKLLLEQNPSKNYIAMTLNKEFQKIETTILPVKAIYTIEYNNPLFNHKEFPAIHKIAKEKGGEIATTELMSMQLPNIYELLKVKKAEEIVDRIIEQNFFLSNTKGKDFIQVIARNFDKKTLLTILELGREQDIAEQIVTESETQSIDKVIYTLLGKEMPITGIIENIENIVSKEELNQLRIAPNGMFNNWSNKAYQRISGYIDNLAKNLDDMLNIGKSGNQVAVTIALLQEWLNFAVSGQRFVSMSKHFPDNDYDDYPYGGGSGSNDGNNNHSAEHSDNQVELLVGLSFNNGTDYK